MALTKVTGQVIKNTTDVTVGVLTVTNTLAVGGTVSIGGTLTYEDVTNVDAVGLITARNGIVVGSGITLSKDGDIFFTGIITGNGSGLTNLATDLVNDTSPQLGGNLDVNTKNIVFGDSGGASDDRLTFGAGTDLEIYHDGSNSYIDEVGTGGLLIRSGNIYLRNPSNADMIHAQSGGYVKLYYSGSEKLATTSSGVSVTGSATVSGDVKSTAGIVDIRSGSSINTNVTGASASGTLHKNTTSGEFAVVSGGTGGNNHLSFYTSASAAPAERVRIDSSGRVLIGSTAKAGDSALQVYTSDKLHPAIRVHSTNANGFTMFGDAYQTDESNINIGISYSSASLVISQGCKVSTSSDNAYVSSQDSYSTKPNVFRLGTDGTFSFLNTNTSATTTTDSAVSLTERLRITSAGVTLLGSGAVATPKVTGPGGLDVSQYGISICMGGSSGGDGQSRTNATTKEARLVIPHYTNAEEPMVVAYGYSQSDKNVVNIGGGTGLGNNATEINFNTASNTTTTGASQQWQIASDGDLIATSPGVIHSGSSSGSLTLYGGATNHGGKIQMQGGNGDATIRFYSQPSTSSPAERLRISGLRVLHNCTSNTGGASSGVYVQEYLGHAYNAVKIRDTANTGTANVLVMIAGSNVSGTITQNGSSASYNTSSDYRLKENEVEISDGISRVKNLKPYKFNWKSDPTKIVDGFFAHEAQVVVPESVTGEKDEVADSDIEGKGVKVGDAIYQVMDHSKLVPLLTAALKEAISKIEVLETEVAALKSS